MSREINYDASTVMKKGFPRLRKLGAVSPCGETTPFVHEGRLYRMELFDPSRGTDSAVPAVALIRDRETGEVLSRLGEGCYYHALYYEDGVARVTAVRSLKPALCGETVVMFESRDLRHWTARELFTRPDWRLFNTSLTKGPAGYVLCMEAGEPREKTGVPFTAFFATSPDLVDWTMMPDETAFPTHRYLGGPLLRWSRGWYYLIAVTELPAARYTNYVYRTKDFKTWEVGYYNPMLMPDEDDRKISPYACDLSPGLIRDMRAGFISSNSDVDMCDWQGRTMIVYNAGNQLGFYYLCEAEYDGTVDELLAAYFDE